MLAPDDSTESRILEAAHRVFVRRGMDGARMQEVAGEAGVNKALLHYYFRSKDRLAEAVFLRAASSFFPRLAGALAAEGSIEERVRRTVALELAFLEANPFLPGYILSELRLHRERMQLLVRQALPVDALRTEVLGAVQRQLDAEAAEGRLRPLRADDFIVNLAALMVFPFAAAPMLEVLLGLDPAGFDAFIARRKEELADFYLRALRP